MDFLLDSEAVTIYAFIFSRISGMFLFAPFYGAQNIPMQVKVLFIAVLSYIVQMTGVAGHNIPDNPALWVIFSELLYGMLIGYIAYTYTSAFFNMGKILDFQLGFGMANLMDPQTGTQASMFGNFFYAFLTLLFLGLNGHHFILKSVVDSFKVCDIGNFYFTKAHLDMVVEAFRKAFEIGAILSFPVILVAILSDILLGVLSKTMPQLNIFVVGMPLKIAVGLAIILIMVPVVLQLTVNVVEQMTDAVLSFIRIG